MGIGSRRWGLGTPCGGPKMSNPEDFFLRFEVTCGPTLSWPSVAVLAGEVDGGWSPPPSSPWKIGSDERRYLMRLGGVRPFSQGENFM